MRDTVIKLEGVGKKYRLSDERRTFVKTFLTPFDKSKEVFALKDINLEIKRGETVGIVGENGSGKSTLLKIIAGITAPTNGEIIVDGRVGSLIELGAGFHQDLTGRENVYLNGILLGFTKKELDQKYKEIIDFADIGQYIEQPVRTYSSGMAVRLGFSVAIHMDPEILLIDEVLAVGDEEFKRKCFQKIIALKKEKVTILFVSHDLPIIKNICSRIILLEKGKIIADGKPKSVIEKYLEIIYRDQSMLEKLNFRSPGNLKIKGIGTKEAKITKIELCNNSGSKTIYFNSQDTINIKIGFQVEGDVSNPIFGISIYTADGILVFGTNTLLADKKISVKKTPHEQIVQLSLISQPLLPGTYLISAGIFKNALGEPYDFYDMMYSFIIKNNPKVSLFSGISHIKHSWRFEK